MRLKQRLEAAEKRATGGAEPLIVFFKTFYEDRNGETAFELRKAVIVGGPNQCDYLEPEDGESMDAFDDRVRETCVRLYGKLPKDEQRPRARAKEET